MKTGLDSDRFARGFSSIVRFFLSFLIIARGAQEHCSFTYLRFKRFPTIITLHTSISARLLSQLLRSLLTPSKHSIDDVSMKVRVEDDEGGTYSNESKACHRICVKEREIDETVNGLTLSSQG